MGHKFIDEIGLGRLWERIKSKLPRKFNIDDILPTLGTSNKILTPTQRTQFTMTKEERADLVENGGARLLYSTGGSSISVYAMVMFSEQNNSNILRFLAEFPDNNVVDLTLGYSSTSDAPIKGTISYMPNYKTASENNDGLMSSADKVKLDKAASIENTDETDNYLGGFIDYDANINLNKVEIKKLFDIDNYYSMVSIKVFSSAMDSSYYIMNDGDVHVAEFPALSSNGETDGFSAMVLIPLPKSYNGMHSLQICKY